MANRRGRGRWPPLAIKMQTKATARQHFPCTRMGVIRTGKSWRAWGGTRNHGHGWRERKTGPRGGHSLAAPQTGKVSTRPSTPLPGTRPKEMEAHVYAQTTRSSQHSSRRPRVQQLVSGRAPRGPPAVGHHSATRKSKAATPAPARMDPERGAQREPGAEGRTVRESTRAARPERRVHGARHWVGGVRDWGVGWGRLGGAGCHPGGLGTL